jgi:hypothetical protein
MSASHSYVTVFAPAGQASSTVATGYCGHTLGVELLLPLARFLVKTHGSLIRSTLIASAPHFEHVTDSLARFPLG